MLMSPVHMTFRSRLGLADEMVHLDLGAMASASGQEIPEGRRTGVLAS